MKSVRIWILILAATSFLTGTAAGLLLAPGTRGEADRGHPFADYEQMFLDAFELDPVRRQALRQILVAYADELEDVRQRHLSAYMSSMEEELEALGRRCEGTIRDHLLVGSARDRFEECALGRPYPN